MRRRKRIGLAATVATAAVTAGTAFAVITPLDDIELTGPGTVTWDYEVERANHFLLSEGTSSPGNGDAVDGFYEVFVGNDAYRADENGNADLIGTNRVIGTTQKLGKLRVTRTDDALATRPTLRALLEFQNPKKKTVKTDVTVDGSYGSDSQTLVVDSSSNDGIFDQNDRWAITTDDPATPSDAVVTTVNYGKGKVLKPKFQRGPTSAIDDGATLEANEDISDTWRLTVPGKKTVYLMFFLEVHDTVTEASTDVDAFDSKGLDATLLTDISASVRKKIVNWDLGG